MENPPKILRAVTPRPTNTVSLLKPLSATVLAVGLLPLLGQSAQAASDSYATDAASGLFSTSFTDGTATPTTGGTSSPASGDSLYFGTETTGVTTVSNDLSGFTFAGLNFLSGASAFTIGGNAFTNTAAGFVNNSTNIETISAPFTIASGTNMAVTTASGATTVLSGAITSTSSENIILGGAGTTILSGSNSNYRGATFMAGTGALQLQFNAGNTTGGVSNVLGNDNASNTNGNNGAQIVFANNGVLQLRGDTTARYTTRALLGLNNTTFTLDVNQLTSAGTGQTLSFIGDNANFANAVTINATGGNGYIAGFSNLSVVSGPSASLTLNPTTAGLSFGGLSSTVASGTAVAISLTLGGTDTTGNSKVTGPITNSTVNNASASVSVAKSNSSTWTLTNAGNAYSGGTTVSAGTLILAATTAATTTTSATGTGSVTVNGGTLQMNNNNQTFATAAFTLGGGTLNVNNTTQATGALTLASTSTLNFGAGSTAASMKFSSLASFASGATLNITNFNTGDVFNIGSTLTSAQLAQISDPGFTASQNASNDNIIFTANAVPEPSTWLALGIGSLTLMMMRGRRERNVRQAI